MGVCLTQRLRRLGGAVLEMDHRWVLEVAGLNPCHRKAFQPAVRSDEVRHEAGRRVAEDGRRGVVLLEDSALAQHRDAITQTDGLLDVVSDEDDGLVHLLLEPEELLLQPVTRNRVDRAEGLVHEQHRRVCREGSGHADPLALTPRELRGVAPREDGRVEPHELEQLGRARLATGPVPAEEGRDRGDVLLDRLVREQAHLLDDVADSPAHLDRVFVRDVVAVDEDSARGRLDQPVDHAHRRRLAAAGRADQDADLAPGDIERQLAYGDRAVAVALLDPVESDHRVRVRFQP